MSKEQEKLVLTNKEWDLLIKHLSSILSKTKYLKDKKSSANLRNVKTDQIIDKTFECLKIIKYKV
jgi:tRNA C32,U32 (ribose-2'-O)-methylase TrmJ